MADRNLLLMGCRSKQKYAFFEKALECGYKIHLVRDGLESEVADVHGHIPITAYNFEKLEQVIDTVVAYADVVPIHGVVAPYDSVVPAAAAIGERLGLRGLEPSVAEALRRKEILRSLCALHGLPAPRAEAVTSVEDAQLVAARIGFPVVVKPTLGTASVGVVRADGPQELRDAFCVAQQANVSSYDCEDVLVEEYVVGIEYTVETAVAEGRLLYQVITEKPRDMPGPSFAEIEHITPPLLDESSSKELQAANSRVIQLLGISDAVIHAEYRLSKSGPQLIDIGGRAAGAWIPEIVKLAWGIDLVEDQIRIAMGDAAGGGIVGPKCHAGFIGIVSERSGYFRGLEGLDEIRALPGVVRAELMVEPGEFIPPFPEHRQEDLAFVLATASSHAKLRAVLGQAVSLARPELSDE